jgi:hypothetical protein
MRRFALAAGLACAVVDTALMLPLTFPTGRDKRVAMTAAFIERFVLGLTVGPVTRTLGGRGLVIGPAYGLLASIPSAMITGTRAPILAMGAVNGLAVGAAYDRLVAPAG